MIGTTVTVRTNRGHKVTGVVLQHHENVAVVRTSRNKTHTGFIVRNRVKR